MMEQEYHRGIFSWPSEQWIQQDEGSLCPRHLGVDVIQQDPMKDLYTLVENATREERDVSVAVFDLGAVVERYLLWVETFPNIQPFYAVKAYDDPVVISVLTRLGAGLDCASQKEIDIALKCGVPQSNIIFASTVKFPSHLAFAHNNDVTLVTVDNEEEMHKIKRYAPRSKLVIRMAALPSAKVEFEFCVKFGCSRKGAARLLKLARQLDLDIVGISFHVGSGCTDAQTYIDHFKIARGMFDDAEKEGFHLKLLDIGGGLFGNIGAEEDIKLMAGPIKDALEELFPKVSGLKVIAEPGRYFVESALFLSTGVIGKRIPGDGLFQHTDINGFEVSCKEVTDKAPKAEAAFEYYISESMYGLLRIHVDVKGYEYNISPLKIQATEGAPTYVSKLWGPSLDSNDVVVERCTLPELHIGDWLVFQDIGSYSVVGSTTFNGFPRPNIRRVIKQTAWDKLVQTITCKSNRAWSISNI